MGGENQVYETFQPGLAFSAPTINISASDSDAHYIIYGVADHGQCR